jgi:plastocyanin
VRICPAGVPALLLLVGCNSTGSYGGPSDPYIGTKDVSIVNYAFTPATVRPDSAGHVVWTWNGDTVTHNVTFEGAITGSGDRNSGTFTGTFLNPGTYRFRCTHHSTAFGSGMHGTVVVGVAAPPDTGGGGYGY